MYLFEQCRRMLIGALITSSCYSAVATDENEHWWREPFGMLQTNLRVIDADMDVNDTADYIVEHGATAWLQSVGGILANYPSELDFHAINPDLSKRSGGDLIQDSLDAARAKGLRLLGRMDFSKIQREIAEEHPEWVFKSHNGTWQTHTHDLVSVCPSGDWYQERVFDILEEVTTRYELEGFFVNWAGYNENDYFRNYWGVCHCDACQRRWAEYAGDEELPKGKEDDNYTKWKDFSNGVINEWTARVRQAIAKNLPDAALILGESADVMFFETNNEVDREIWHHLTSETASKFMSFRPEVPVVINSAAFLGHGYRIATENNDNFVQYHLQAISRGANPSSYIIGLPEKLPWTNLPAASEIMKFHRDHKSTYTGLRPIAKTAIVLPQESQFEEVAFKEAMNEYKGLYSALQELHVPFDVIAQQYLARVSDSGGLSRYTSIILPGLGALKSNDTKALDAWVSSGGSLIATTPVGIDSEDNVQLNSLPASRQISNTTNDMDVWSTYIAPAEQPGAKNHYYQGPLIPILWQHQFFEWKNESSSIYGMLDYAPFAPIEYVYGHLQNPDQPGAGFSTFDNGTGVIIPFAIGRGYRGTGYDTFRDFFELILKEHGAKEDIVFDVNEQVEVTVNRNAKGEIVVHLINLSGRRFQNWRSHLPIPASVIRVPGAEGITAKALVCGSDLEVEDGKIQVPSFDLFEVVVIEGLE